MQALYGTLYGTELKSVQFWFIFGLIFVAMATPLAPLKIQVVYLNSTTLYTLPYMRKIPFIFSHRIEICAILVYFRMAFSYVIICVKERPRCSLFTLWQKYKCKKCASNIALCYGVNIDESSFYCYFYGYLNVKEYPTGHHTIPCSSFIRFPMLREAAMLQKLLRTLLAKKIFSPQGVMSKFL